jgi:hypothetical protein
MKLYQDNKCSNSRRCFDAANKYFLIDNTRIIIAGKGADVIGIGKPNIYFDKFGHPTAKPISK